MASSSYAASASVTFAISFLPLPQSPTLPSRTLFPSSNTFTTPRLRLRRPISPLLPAAAVVDEQPTDTEPKATDTEPEPDEPEPEPITVETLHRFFDLNVGKWRGFFYVCFLTTIQFNGNGKMMQKISTRLSVSTYGEDDLISLIQTLYIKQPSLSSSATGHDDDEPEWAEYKIKETNMFTVDKYQQIGFFPDKRAFALRYQTVGMLEYVLRQGVLGEDDTGEDSPRNLKIPSRKPSVVCENCLYSQEIDRRVRAFHIMNPGGVLDMLLMFVEDRDDRKQHPPPPSSLDADNNDRLRPFLGRWEGRSITKRSGVYDSTLAEADNVVLLEMNEEGQLIQDIATTTDASGVTTNVNWIGTMVDNLIVFDGGYQTTLLPGGMYMGCPCDIGKIVAESKSFHLEFCWIESPGKRQRLVRTYDVDGLAVSSTYFFETKM